MTSPRSTSGDGVAPRYRAFVDGASLAYVSDYLSFVRADAAGRVCFALDTNRGYNAEPPPAKGLPAERLQAEHAYAVLHDEHAGWVPQSCVQRYPHPALTPRCPTATGSPGPARPTPQDGHQHRERPAPGHRTARRPAAQCRRRHLRRHVEPPPPCTGAAAPCAAGSSMRAWPAPG